MFSNTEAKTKTLSAGDRAPDFTLPDHTGKPFRLPEVYQTQNVLLVFNLGFF
jgi:peroxiredoxin